MATANFTVKYDGKALHSHEMDVALLAPALMAMSNIVKEASKLETNGEYEANLNVKGNIKAGSIEIELTSHAISLFDQVTNLLTSNNMNALVNFGGVIALIDFVFKLIRFLKGGDADKVEVQDSNVIIYKNNKKMIVTRNAYNVYVNYELRKDIYDVVKPLEEDGFEEFSIFDEKETFVKVHEDEAFTFKPPSISTKLHETVARKILVIESLTFKDGNKWTFSDGSFKLNASISDENFNSQIETGERFAKGDWLEVLLKTTQTKENGKLKTEHEIIEVIEHLTKEQYKLDI